MEHAKQKLKIAHVVPVATPIPAPLGGSVEQVSYLLTEELVRRGHAVTLFATGNTQTSARLAALFPHGYYEDLDMWPWEHYEMMNLAAACERADEFDVIHYEAAYYPMSTVFSRLVKTPLSQTIHLQPPPEQVALWRYYAEANFVAISAYQRHALEGLNCAATIFHGLDLANFPFRDMPEEYLVFLGRFTPGKGILQAIEVAKRTGLRLKMAAAETEYYYEEVKQHVDGRQIEYLGELGHADKVRLLGGARTLLYPIQTAEPFGLVLTEAMACGTPVVALNKGAVPEIVINGLSGYVVETLDEMVERLPEVMALPRESVRWHAEAHFSAEAMTDGYEELFYRLAAAKTGNNQGGSGERSADAASSFCVSRR
jgi:glycosyltransferase involved in cell wall biosynthesis